MDAQKVLILEFDRDFGYAQALSGILESAKGLLLISTVVREFSPLAAAPSQDRFDATVIATPRLTDAVHLSLKSDLTGRNGPVIVVAGEVSHTETIDLLRSGVSDVLPGTPTAATVVPCLWRLLHWSSGLGQKLKQEVGLSRMIGTSPRFVAEVNKIRLAARCDAAVLIMGETGTGKELFARAIHYLSPRQHGPFTPVNCGAIPSELVENELFGHFAGAFTGATAGHSGLIEESELGTLFLDEIDALSPAAQVKLLRLLQDKEYRPLGSAKTRVANVRVISATNSNTADALECGRLRRDLYYRLNVFPIVLPPLRARRDDIPALARHFLAKHAATLNPRVRGFAPGAFEALMQYDWPGNVRELEHIVERALVLCDAAVIEPADLGIASERRPEPAGFREAKAKVVTEFEKSYLQRLLSAHGGNVSEAARAAKKNRRAFFQLLRKHAIRVDEFRHDFGRARKADRAG